MGKLKSPKQLKKFYQRHLERMMHSFLMQTAGQDEVKIKEVYKSFCNNWNSTVNKINARYGSIILNHDAWTDLIEVEGYKRIQTKFMPRKHKAELLRIIKICEGKSDAYWNLRQAKYKVVFVIVIIKSFFKKLFNRKKPTVA